MDVEGRCIAFHCDGINPITRCISTFLEGAAGICDPTATPVVTKRNLVKRLVVHESQMFVESFR